MALLAVFMLASCAKEGPMGPVGPQGPAGYDGLDGHDGNANVCSSTLTVYPNDWYLDNGSWRVDFDYAAINTNIYGSGAVLVYMKTDNVWNQLQGRSTIPKLMMLEKKCFILRHWTFLSIWKA